MTTVRRSSLVLLALGVSLGLLLFQLGNLISGVSARELQTKQLSSSLHALAHHAPYWHYDALVWLFGWLPGHQTWTLRFASVIYALIAIAALTYVMRRWYGPRTAIFGFFIVVCSAWLLHAGRLATHDIVLLTTVAALLGSSVYLYDDPESNFRFVVWTGIRLLALAVPGMIWLVILDAIFHRDDIKLAFYSLNRWLPKCTIIAMSVLFLAPIVAGLLLGQAMNDGLALLGLPNTLPTLTDVGQTAGHTLLNISIYGTAPDDIWLNHLPLLGAFLTALLVMGIYFYATHVHAARTKHLLGYSLVLFVVICASGPVTFSVLVPIIYLVVAGGLAYLLHLWLKVFPKNPLARNIGIGMVALALLISCNYSLRQYFVAWQHHPEAVKAFEHRELTRSTL